MSDNFFPITRTILRGLDLLEDVIGIIPNGHFANLRFKNLHQNRWMRFKVVCFCYCNGLPLELFFDFRENVCLDTNFDRSPYITLHKLMDENRAYRSLYSSWNIENQRLEYLNGNPYQGRFAFPGNK